jgi:hypothetical protein
MARVTLRPGGNQSVVDYAELPPTKKALHSISALVAKIKRRARFSLDDLLTLFNCLVAKLHQTSALDFRRSSLCQQRSPIPLAKKPLLIS